MLGGDARIVVSPVLGIVVLPIALESVPRFLVLTSAHAADAAGREPRLAGLTAYCVGDRTADAARAAGLHPLSAGGAAEDLLALLRRERPEGPGLWLRGRHAAADIAAALAGDGIILSSAVAYDQEARELSAEALAALAGRGRVILPVYSPRSARLLAAACAGARAPLEVVAISAQAAAGWPEPAQVAAVAAAPEGASMEREIVALVRTRSAC